MLLLIFKTLCISLSSFMAIASPVATINVHSPENLYQINMESLPDSALAAVDISFQVYDIEGVSQGYKGVMKSGIEAAYSHAPFISDAFALFDSLTTMRPDRPEGFFLKAAMFSTIYRFEPKQSNFDSLKFYTEKTIDLAENLLKKHPNDLYLNFYLGGVYGNVGLYYLKRHSYIKAYLNGRKGKNYLEKAVEIDPEFADAHMGLGVYLYYADILSPIMKSILFIIGLGGDREEGLRKIKYSVQNGMLSQVESKYFLAKLYNEHDGKSTAAKQLLKSLVNRFPENFYYKYKYANMLYECGEYKNALVRYESLLKAPQNEFSAFTRILHFYRARLLHLTGNYKKSNLELRASGNYNTFSEAFYAERLYLTGMNYEILGNRMNAVTYYKQAARMDADILKKKAKKLLEQPLTNIDILTINVDAMLKNELYEDAKILCDSILKTLNSEINNNISEDIAIVKLMKSEALAALNMSKDSYELLDTVPEEYLRKDSELYARYIILSTKLSLMLKNGDKAANIINRAEDIDLKKIPVPLNRKILSLQYDIFGQVRFR